MCSINASRRLTAYTRIGLKKLYETAVYRIDAPGGSILVQIDAAKRPYAGPRRIRPGHWTADDPRASKLFPIGADSAAIVTADNPYSRHRAATFNAAAHHRLILRVRKSGHRFLHAAGIDVSGRWPPEPGLCILGCSLRHACDLAAAFGQAAFVWIERGCGARVQFT
ncbi:DUF3293 domain-containing protein [Fodinicurvata sp. EGI_FJ10296]|uniref:DUF3293 domain-containing protein n=1 Tax=Fodinicurvata sp. EGI_FJ10296 TaxID=3231908 RepID=UPI003452D59B